MLFSIDLSEEVARSKLSEAQTQTLETVEIPESPKENLVPVESGELSPV